MNQIFLKKALFFCLIFILTITLQACFSKKENNTNIWDEKDTIDESGQPQVSEKKDFQKASSGADADKREDQLIRKPVPKDEKSLKRLVNQLKKNSNKKVDVDISEDDINLEMDDIIDEVDDDLDEQKDNEELNEIESSIDNL